MGFAIVLLACGAALVTALVLTPGVRKLALAQGWVSTPRVNRHGQREVALLGGIAIFGAVMVGSALVWNRLEPQQAGLLVAASMMFLVGLVDDRLSLKPHTKLIAQFVAAWLLVESGVRLGLDTSLGQPNLQPLDTLLTMALLVGITNAFNLLDNMDGLCAGIATIAAGSLAVLQASEGHWVAATLCAAMAAAASVSQVQLLPRPNLHGRLRQPVHRHVSGRRPPWPRRLGAENRTSCRSLRCRCWC